MSRIKIAAIIFAVLILSVVTFVGYMGMFSTVTISEKEMGPYLYAFKKNIGPYSGTAGVFDSVNNTLTSNGVISETGIGVYFDNPSEVDASKLRSDCGSIIKEEDLVKVKGIKDLSISTIPEMLYITAEFPIKNGLSYMFGPMKIYPAMTVHMNKNRYKPAPGIEIYDIKKEKIIYIMPVIKSN